MISVEHVRTFAAYNAWQNRSLYQAAAGLSDAERRAERGAFFGSIHKTLNHVLWGDRVWMSRFADTPKPPGGIRDSVTLVADWEDLRSARVAFDATIADWAAALAPQWLEGELVWWSGAANAELRRPRWLAVTHFFNHQTHHRGQVHAMLTAAGAKPEDTDLVFMPS
jgi:uncharacterized damage-inducible protein DinB